jgi:hypothetical protein
MSKFYVFTLRDVKSSPVHACVFEYEDVLIRSLSATVISPKDVQTLKLSKTDNEPIHLFLAGFVIGDIVESLRYLKYHLDQFAGIYGYITDSFLIQSEINKPAWRRSVSSFYRYTKKITRLFVPFEYSVRECEDFYNIPVSFIPQAADVLNFGDASKHKFIDINGYGRQEVNCSKLLSMTYNQQKSTRIYHHTDHMRVDRINDNLAHRRFFWQLLRGSKIALAFDGLAANNDKRFTHSFIGLRWFESTAAGCVIVGRRPTCDEMNRLFPLQNSTIELPHIEKEILPFFEALLSDEKKLTSIGANNYLHALEKNDWRYRFIDMLAILGITPPAPLLEEIAQLSKAREDFIKINQLMIKLKVN